MHMDIRIYINIGAIFLRFVAILAQISHSICFSVVVTCQVMGAFYVENCCLSTVWGSLFDYL